MKLIGQFFLDCARFFDKRFVFFAHMYMLFLIVVLVVAKFVEGMGLFMMFDGALLDRAIAMRTETLSVIMRGVTALGHWMIVWMIVAIVGLELAARRRVVQFVALFLSVAGASLVAIGLKELLVRPRPETLSIVSETTFSFPSGHTSLSLALYGILIYFLLRCDCATWMKYAGTALGLALILGVGFSRVYLGVHWPSDVIGGYVLTAGWLAIIIIQTERMGKRKMRVN